MPLIRVLVDVVSILAKTTKLLKYPSSNRWNNVFDLSKKKLISCRL